MNAESAAADHSRQIKLNVHRVYIGNWRKWIEFERNRLRYERWRDIVKRAERLLKGYR